MAMKLQFFYDAICPYSWLGYQIIRQKLPIWKTCSNVEIEYIPFPLPYVYTRSVSLNYSDKCVAEKEYKFRNLNEIVQQYGLEQATFENMYCDNLRNRSTLLFLNILRREHPRLYPQFMELIWQQIFVKKQPVTSVSHYLKMARELNIQYQAITDVILKIEQPENIHNSETFVEQLIGERITGSPWIKFTSEYINMEFSEILRLELIDEIIRDPLILPHSNKLDRISAL